mmetsp:Transcript_56102/g.121354  ORF Transcript_56102/g.121354 Transcript_56102/m.121354 type:complete len:251 (+) Transcript_56102:180-932(+)
MASPLLPFTLADLLGRGVEKLALQAAVDGAATREDAQHLWDHAPVHHVPCSAAAGVVVLVTTSISPPSLPDEPGAVLPLVNGFVPDGAEVILESAPAKSHQFGFLWQLSPSLAESVVELLGHQRHDVILDNRRPITGRALPVEGPDQGTTVRIGDSLLDGGLAAGRAAPSHVVAPVRSALIRFQWARHVQLRLGSICCVCGRELDWVDVGGSEGVQGVGVASLAALSLERDHQHAIVSNHIVQASVWELL